MTINRGQETQAAVSERPSKNEPTSESSSSNIAQPTPIFENLESDCAMEALTREVVTSAKEVNEKGADEIFSETSEGAQSSD